MATATPLTYHGLNSGLGDGRGVRLQVATPSGLVREIPLERAEVMRILKSAVQCLDQLDIEARRAARVKPTCSACGHPNPGDWCPGCGRQA